MRKEIVEIIYQQTEVLMQNVQNTLDILENTHLMKMLSDMPLWKHIYHMLHSLDQWFINPYKYEEPSFHDSNMNSLYVLSEKVLTKDELISYFKIIKYKINKYLKSLNDESLSEKPENCNYTKLTLVLAQYRHLMYHIGFLHCFILNDTGKWPEYIGISPPIE